MGRWLLVAALVVGAAAPAPAQEAAGDPRVDALEKEVAALRAEIAALRAAGSDAERLAEIERRIDALAAELESLRIGEAATADRSDFGMGPAASKVYRAEPGLSIGGYGELLYEGFDSRRDDGAPSNRTDQLDLLRAIVYVGYKFDDRFLFNSEIEYEHAKAGEGQTGEVAVEFAYLDWLWRPELNLRGGLVLVPMGLLNELHEPTVFLGARRPQVEQVILPSTWRENGFGFFGEAGPVSYRAYVVNGLAAAGFTAGSLRGGRQNGARAKAEDFALVGRVDWTSVPGLLLGGSVYLGDSGQDLRGAGGRVAVGTRIVEGHAEWKWRGLELRGLVARADLDDVAALNRARGLTGTSSIGERLAGHYLQAGYDLLAGRGRQALVPYLRWEALDTQDEVPSGFARNPANDVEILTAGLAYRPIDQIVLKADFQDVDNAAGSGVDQLNVALGWIF